MTYAIAGVTGHTGRVVADTLLARREKVRVVVRDAQKGASWKERGAEVAVAELGDAKALAAALRGAEGAYLLIPPNYAAADFRQYQDATSRAVAAAVAESRVPHVVLLSSVGAQVPSGTGPIAGLHATEKRLGEARGTVVSSLRAGYFLENFGQSLGMVKQAGVLPSFFPADLKVPMVSTLDIGRLAAELLLAPPVASQVVELGTDRTTAEIAGVLGELLGKPVAVQVAPLAAVSGILQGLGLPRGIADLYAEMTAGIVNGTVTWEGGHRRAESPEPLGDVFRRLLGA